MINPQQAAENWSRGLGQSTEKIKAGINAVTESPTAKAARSIDRMVAGVVRSAGDGTTAAALNRVTLEDWKRAALEKGVGRIASGAAAAKGDFANFMTAFLPAVESARASLQPRGDLETNLQRANDMARKLSAFRYRR